MKRHRLVIDFGKPRAHAANNAPLMLVAAQRQLVENNCEQRFLRIYAGRCGGSVKPISKARRLL